MSFLTSIYIYFHLPPSSSHAQVLSFSHLDLTSILSSLFKLIIRELFGHSKKNEFFESLCYALHNLHLVWSDASITCTSNRTLSDGWWKGDRSRNSLCAHAYCSTCYISCSLILSNMYSKWLHACELPINCSVSFIYQVNLSLF